MYRLNQPPPPLLLTAFYVGASAALFLTISYFLADSCRIDARYFGKPSDGYCALGGIWVFNFGLLFSGVFPLGLIILAPLVMGILLLIIHLQSRKKAASIHSSRSLRLASLFAALAPLAFVFLFGMIGWGLNEEYLDKQCYQNAEEQICAHGMAAFQSAQTMLSISLPIGVYLVIIACWHTDSLSKIQSTKIHP